ncbi:DUF6090 family protein [Hanstruepera ponticola]|uniref:DUF6090 family protein n=1 Tax=Hanstruepera ponticola TaxID=2042995 RepID=UPI000CF0E381|nr:DUF6090 family protein [Hanstruepera ponticola]
MIKFFRHIRQQLLSEGKTGKYFKYAIGEIVLVVIGILIALQINTVKNKNDKRAEEITHLENILSDLKQDKSELIKIIDRRQSKTESATVMESYYHTKKVDSLNRYYFHWTNVLMWETHNPSLVTFKELINSGKLSTLTNENVKQLLLQIDYNYNQMFELRNHLYHDYTDYFYKPFGDFIDYENGLKAFLEPNAKIELSREDVEIALKSKRIKNGFTLARLNNQLLSQQLTDILTKVDSTIVLVEQEIKK